MEDYKPKEFTSSQLTKLYVQTKLAVERKLNYPIFGPLKVNGIHRVFPLTEKGFKDGLWFFVTGTGLKKVNKDLFDVVMTFFKDNQSDFSYLVFSEEIKSLKHINYSEDIIVCHRDKIKKTGPIYDDSEELFNKLREDVITEGNDHVLHYYILPYE